MSWRGVWGRVQGVAGGGFPVENEGKGEGSGERGGGVGTGKGTGTSMRTSLSKLHFSKLPFSFFSKNTQKNPPRKSRAKSSKCMKQNSPNFSGTCL